MGNPLMILHGIWFTMQYKCSFMQLLENPFNYYIWLGETKLADPPPFFIILRKTRLKMRDLARVSVCNLTRLPHLSTYFDATAMCHIPLESSDQELSNGMHNSDRTKTEDLPVCTSQSYISMEVDSIGKRITGIPLNLMWF